MDKLTRYVVAAFVLCASTAWAQLSPGDLSRAHASLEGVENCAKCHGSSRELVSEKCLLCHGLIKAERDAGQGLHARPEYRRCNDCHVEHQGRDADLVYWKNGEKSFDHSLTGYTLQGKHADLTCRQCHQPKFIGELDLLAGERIDSAHTYLGLTQACLGCHVDEHRGQLGGQCAKCHSQTAWKPTAGFNHARTGFPLLGLHAAVPCAKCHKALADQPVGNDLDYIKYIGVAHDQCTACHADFHAGKLGGSCASCHTASGWRQVVAGRFDHAKTRFPLEGRHAAVACDKCHRVGRPTAALNFAACRDCHADSHNGDFAQRPLGGACEECHTVSGFTPSKFVTAQHEQTKYPLRGAHQAVPCIACHKTAQAGVSVYRFKFTSTRCSDCHANAHVGQLDTLLAASGCEGCHAVASWSAVSYDHSRTGFALDGKHTAVACVKCHGDNKVGSGPLRLKFAGLRTNCESCHADTHHGQFALADGVCDCSRCHAAARWRPSTFNHQTASRFKLDGAHVNVACRKCHPSIGTGAEAYVQYKPVDPTCASCHGVANTGEHSRL